MKNQVKIFHIYDLNFFYFFKSKSYENKNDIENHNKN